MQFRMDAEESPSPEWRATQREPTALAEATYPRTTVASTILSRPEIPGRWVDGMEEFEAIWHSKGVEC